MKCCMGHFGEFDQPFKNAMNILMASPATNNLYVILEMAQSNPILKGREADIRAYLANPNQPQPVTQAPIATTSPTPVPQLTKEQEADIIRMEKELGIKKPSSGNKGLLIGGGLAAIAAFFALKD